MTFDKSTNPDDWVNFRIGKKLKLGFKVGYNVREQRFAMSSGFAKLPEFIKTRAPLAANYLLEKAWIK